MSPLCALRSAREPITARASESSAASVGVMNDHLFPGASGIGFNLSCVYVACGVASRTILTCGHRAFTGSVARRPWGLS